MTVTLTTSTPEATERVAEVIGRNLIFAAPDRSTRNFSQPYYSFVGVDSKEQKRRRGMSAERSPDGPLRMDRHLNRYRFYASDLHG